MDCSNAAHDLMRASGVAFRASVRLTFRSWGVDEAGRDGVYQYGICNRCTSCIGIPISLLDDGNRHENHARAVKVGKILAQVPVGARRAEIDALADCLVTFDREQRTRFAAAAGVLPPSDATWAEVVAGARGRLTAEEIFARAMTPEGMRA